MSYPEIPLAKLPKKQRFRFLSLCGINLEGARQAIKLTRVDLGASAVVAKILFQALAEAAVIRYTRPFSGSNTVQGKKTRLKREYLEDIFSRPQLALHKKMYDLRNTTVAHTQAKNRRMKHVRIPGLYGHKPQTISMLPIKCPSPHQFDRLMVMIDLLEAKIKAERDPIAPKP